MMIRHEICMFSRGQKKQSLSFSVSYNLSFRFYYIWEEMESEDHSEFLKTNNIIYNRCRKDHFNYVNNLPPKRQNSIYKTQIATPHHPQPNNPKTNKQPSPDNAQDKIKPTQQIFQASLVKQGSLGTSSSIYKSSFENSEDTKAPERAHEQESFFKKQDHFQPPSSAYNRMSLHLKDENKILYSIEKGKGRSGNLGIPKYNRMNSSSIYKGDFTGKAVEKLPSIYQNKEQGEKGLQKKSRKQRNMRG